MSSRANRKFDVIVYGASGYSGAITCEYIANKAPRNFKWAIAGRDKVKLDELKKRLEEIDPQYSNLETFVADATNFEQIKKLCDQTRVFISFVGPYRKFGVPIVRACVEAETDYVDVTGEPPFYNEVIDKYNDIAKEKKLYIVPACGIGSLITDFAVETLKEEFQKEGESCISANTYLRYNGKYAKNFSSGTWNTLVNSLSSKPPRTDRKKFPETRRKRAKRQGLHVSRYSWAYPFVEGADKHTINRTNELTLGSTGNIDFNYQQFTLLPLIPPLWLLKTLFLMFIVLFFSKFSFVSNLLKKRKIDNGGPTKEQRDQCSVDVFVDARSENKKKTLHLHAPSPYDTTGIACAETAFALALERDKLNQLYGVVTPGAIMTKQLQKHLKERGNTTWKVIDN